MVLLLDVPWLIVLLRSTSSSEADVNSSNSYGRNSVDLKAAYTAHWIVYSCLLLSG